MAIYAEPKKPGLISSLLPMAGSLVGGFFGGPAGAAVGGKVGGTIGGNMNKSNDEQNAISRRMGDMEAKTDQAVDEQGPAAKPETLKPQVYQSLGGGKPKTDASEVLVLPDDGTQSPMARRLKYGGIA